MNKKNENEIILYTEEDVILMHSFVNEKIGFTIESVINHYNKANKELIKIKCNCELKKALK